LTPLLDLSY
jgi:hypothetical protein